MKTIENLKTKSIMSATILNDDYSFTELQTIIFKTEETFKKYLRSRLINVVLVESVKILEDEYYYKSSNNLFFEPSLEYMMNN